MHYGTCAVRAEEGLWTPRKYAGPGTFAVTEEHIRHMKARVQLFRATEKVLGELVDCEDCKECFCLEVVEESTAFAHRDIPRAPGCGPPALPPASGDKDAEVVGFVEFVRAAQLPEEAALRFKA